MSLHQKAYREPDPIVTDPETLRKYVRLLRTALEATIDDYIVNGSHSHPRPIVQKVAHDALEATKEL